METSLLDGVTLAGWRPVPRTYGHAWPGGPTIAELFPKMPPDYDVNAWYVFGSPVTGVSASTLEF